MDNRKNLIALLTNHDDDVYCFRRELVETLTGDGYEMLVSCPYGEKLELMKNIDFIYNDTQIDRRGTNIIRDFKLLIHYYKLLKKYKPAVVLTYTAKPNVYGSLAASWLKIPYINNVTGLGSVSQKEGFIKRLVMFLLRKAFRKSSCIFFQNNENMEWSINQGLVKGKYKLIPGSGVNINRFSLQPYPSGSEKIIFNYIGRVMKDKGVDNYIEAAKRIKVRYRNTEFNIIGFIEPSESHYFNKLKGLQEKDIIIYRGNQKDVRPFIARSHCTIHPSIYGEGMSNVLLESAASGRPLITTDIAGCRETVINDVTGFIYSAGNVEELESKIIDFLSLTDDERFKMGLLGRKRIEEFYDREKVVNAYSEEINHILVNFSFNKASVEYI